MASSYDIVVVGDGAAGVGAAVSAAREGKSVLLVGRYKNLGGMITNGISNTDLGIAPLENIRNFPNKTGASNEQLSNGLFEEFRQLIKRHYNNSPACEKGFRYEPKVAQNMIRQLVQAESNIDLELEAMFESVSVSGGKIRSVRILKNNGRRSTINLSANGFVIDCTDCGDVAVASGCNFEIGREGKTATGETFAGLIYWDHFGAFNSARYRFLKTQGQNTTHRGDNRVQAYSYLMTIKDYGGRAPNVISTVPAGYDKSNYEIGVPFSETWAIRNGHMPNQKYEVNVHPKGSDLQEINYNYHSGNRSAIEQQYRDHALGYLYYIQNELGLDQYGLANDEYTDNGNFPYRLYVRESRRITGKYVFNEADATPFEMTESAGGYLSGQYKTYTNGVVTKRPPAHWDGIALVSYAMDSHAVRKYQAYRENSSSHRHKGEGEFYASSLTGPAAVPLRVLIPDAGPANLLVAHAVSATHVGYGTLRMEPVRMWMGQAAGVVASVAMDESASLDDFVQQNDPELLQNLQTKLLESPHNLKLYYYADLAGVPWANTAIQLLSLMGIFNGYDNYEFRPARAITRAEFIKIVLVANRIPSSRPRRNYRGYNDVSQNQWYYPFVKQAYELGILALFDQDSNLYPNRPITRSEAATLVLAALNFNVREFNSSSFVDVQRLPNGDKPWYYDIIGTINDLGIMRGDNSQNPGAGSRTFRPNDNLNRAEAAVILYRAIRLA